MPYEAIDNLRPETIARFDARQRWLLFGAGILLVGIALGAILKARPRRSAWS